MSAPPAPSARLALPQDGAAQARADRIFRVALIGVLSGTLFTTTLGLFIPWLVSFAQTRADNLRLYSVITGAAIAIAVAVLGPSGGPPGARLASRVGAIIGGTGTLAVLLGVVLAFATGEQARIGQATLAALAAGGFGTALVVGVLAGIAASTSRGRRGLPSSGVPLTSLVGGATGTLAVATWALATAYVLGHLQASVQETAVQEARDLVQLLAMVHPEEDDRLVAELAPPGGFVARLAEGGRVLPGAVGVAPDEIVHVDETELTQCLIFEGAQRRILPCAEHPLGDGTRLVVAVTDVPLPLSVIAVFLGVGIAAALVARQVGITLGRGPAVELDRVAAILDALGQSGGGVGGLDHPIPAVSLDEVGDLSVALGRLRVRLRPGLVEHDDALTRARHADEERDRLLALVSSELRAPLDRILDAARALLDGKETPLTPSQREDIRLIVTSSTHLIELIEEVLDLSAIATGQINLRVGDVDLGALVSDVARAQRPLLGARAVELKTTLVDDARLRGDERRLRQVVTNLVSNAVKFTVAGSITLSITRDADALVLSVADTGPGMPDEQLPRLFSEFVQLGSLRQRARGTGLGLAICKRLIDAHGGEISAQSQLGAGTTFTVRLPLNGADKGAAAA